MATEKQYPDPETNRSASTDEQLRHSGKDGYEKPVREFDNTPLDKAPLDYDPRTTKEELHTGHLPQDLQLKPERNVKTWQKATAAGAVLLAAVGAGLGLSKATSGETSAEPNSEPSVSAPAIPGETDPASQPVAFVIEAGELANNPEALATAYYDKVNLFLIAGADEEAANADQRYEMTDKEYIEIISQNIDQKFIDELFVPNWENNPKLAHYINGLLESAHSTRWDRLESYAGGTENKEPYVRGIIVEEASGTTDPLSTTVHWRGFDNGDMTTADDNNGVGSINPNLETGGITISWTVVDGQLKISDVDY